MRIALLSGGRGWHVQDLLRAGRERGHDTVALDFRALHSQAWPEAFDGLIVRTMPAGSLEQVVFRMDLLHEAEAARRPIINPPRAVETCVDKHLTDLRLRQAGLPVLLTAVCQRSEDALAAFERLGRDVVVKPLFGSEGRGIIRITERDLAWRCFRAIEQTGGVLYLQQFVNHPGFDIRAFVLQGRVLAAMKRTTSRGWRTNVAQGGLTQPLDLEPALCDLAIRAAAATGAIAAGVDLICDAQQQWYVLEVNAVPGWRALAETCRVDVADAMIQAVARLR